MSWGLLRISYQHSCSPQGVKQMGVIISPPPPPPTPFLCFISTFKIFKIFQNIHLGFWNCNHRSWIFFRSGNNWEIWGLRDHYLSSSSLRAICSQQVGCRGSPSFSILCHSDTVIIWYFCPFLDVIRPHCSRSVPSSSTIYPSFHQQSLYPISSYYMSKILTFPFLDSI